MEVPMDIVTLTRRVNDRTHFRKGRASGETFNNVNLSFFDTLVAIDALQCRCDMRGSVCVLFQGFQEHKGVPQTCRQARRRG